MEPPSFGLLRRIPVLDRQDATCMTDVIGGLCRRIGQNDYIYPVTRLFAYVLAFQVLTSGQVLAEFVKVANLVEHFRMHRDIGDGLDLGTFIRMHYFDPAHEGSDPVEHRQLPLHQSGIHVVVASNPNVASIVLPSIPAESDPDFLSTVTQFRSRPDRGSVFQPPRIHG